MKHFAMYFLASLHFRLLTGGYDDDDADGGGLSVGSQYPSSSSFFLYTRLIVLPQGILQAYIAHLRWTSL